MEWVEIFAFKINLWLHVIICVYLQKFKISNIKKKTLFNSALLK